jgi:hypothetical protein
VENEGSRSRDERSRGVKGGREVTRYPVTTLPPHVSKTFEIPAKSTAITSARGRSRRAAKQSAPLTVVARAKRFTVSLCHVRTFLVSLRWALSLLLSHPFTYRSSQTALYAPSVHQVDARLAATTLVPRNISLTPPISDLETKPRAFFRAPFVPVRAENINICGSELSETQTSFFSSLGVLGKWLHELSKLFSYYYKILLKYYYKYYYISLFPLSNCARPFAGFNGPCGRRLS